MMSAAKPILIAVIVTATIGMTMAAPHAFARHLSDSQRYNDGFNDGSQAAISDRDNGNAFNPACDPTGAHTSDGQHTTEYCSGWSSGYTSAWNGSNSPTEQTFPQNQQQHQRQIQGNDGGFSQGYRDGRADAHQAQSSGGNYDSSCSFGHSDGYCAGYKSGYWLEWHLSAVIH